jgi:hypothetical protein
MKIQTYHIFIGDPNNIGTTTFDFDIDFQCQINVGCPVATALSCGSNLIGESTSGSTVIDP